MNIAILFDMDGTILNTEPLYAKAEIRLFSEYGVVIPKEDLSLFRGCSEEAFYSLSMKKYNIKENKKIFIDKGRKYVRNEFITGLDFMPGFHKMINFIKQNYKTGLVTAAPRHNVDWLCEIIGLDKIFEHIICGDESKKNKPSPDPYIDMMYKLNISPENTIIVEDSIPGIRSALDSGARVIAKTGSVNIKNLTKAHKIITSLEEINDNLIKQLLSKKI